MHPSLRSLTAPVAVACCSTACSRRCARRPQARSGSCARQVRCGGQLTNEGQHLISQGSRSFLLPDSPPAGCDHTACRTCGSGRAGGWVGARAREGVATWCLYCAANAPSTAPTAGGGAKPGRVGGRAGSDGSKSGRCSLARQLLQVVVDLRAARQVLIKAAASRHGRGSCTPWCSGLGMSGAAGVDARAQPGLPTPQLLAPRSHRPLLPPRYAPELDPPDAGSVVVRLKVPQLGQFASRDIPAQLLALRSDALVATQALPPWLHAGGLPATALGCPGRARPPVWEVQGGSQASFGRHPRRYGASIQKAAVGEQPNREWRFMSPSFLRPHAAVVAMLPLFLH